MKYEFTTQLHNIVRIRRRVLKERLEKYNMTPGQPAVLYFLLGNDGCKQRDIAENCKLKPANIVTLLDNMEQIGWVRREHDETDRRAWRIFLTDNGRIVAYEVFEVFSDLDKISLRGLNEPELSTLKSALLKIEDNLSSM